MSETNSIQLKLSAILSVPIKTYCDDFKFIVNGEEFKTNRLISELLSPKICKIHLIDPTIDTFIINTEAKGNFSDFLHLIDFSIKNIPESELPFISEVCELLENENIELSNLGQDIEITNDNIFTLIKKHEKNKTFYHQLFEKEVDFISTHFFEINEKNNEDLLNLDENTLFLIISNENLHLNNEDQLLKFINKLYSNDSQFANFYEFVLFENVGIETINEFIDIFDVFDITKPSWLALSKRLKKEIKENFKEIENNSKRYNLKTQIQSNLKTFSYDGENPFSSIINYLKSKSNGQIENEIDVTASSKYNTDNADDSDDPKCTTVYENHENKSFISQNVSDSWLCFEFKNNCVIPTEYTIRARSLHDCAYPRNWVVEGSKDKNSWEIIDEQNNFNIFNKNNIVHTFKIKNQQSKNCFKYVRIRQTGPNSSYNNYFIINAFELFGNLA